MALGYKYGKVTYLNTVPVADVYIRQNQYVTNNIHKYMYYNVLKKACKIVH